MMNNRFVQSLVVGICLSVSLCLAACGGNAKPNLTPEELLSKIEEANTLEVITAKHPAFTEKYTDPDFDAPSYTYTSKNVWFYHMGESETDVFSYMGPDFDAGINTETGDPYYSAIIDKELFKDTFDLYAMPYQLDLSEHKHEILDNGDFKASNDDEEFVISYDRKDFFKTKEVYTIKGEEEFVVTSEFGYLDKEDDARITDLVNKFVSDKSGGKTVKLTIIDLDGTEATFDFPYGFEPNIYSQAEAFVYKDREDEFYMFGAITEDTTLVGVEVAEEDEDGEYIEVDDLSELDIDDFDFDDVEYYDEDGNLLVEE